MFRRGSFISLLTAHRNHEPPDAQPSAYRHRHPAAPQEDSTQLLVEEVFHILRGEGMPAAQSAAGRTVEVTQASKPRISAPSPGTGQRHPGSGRRRCCRVWGQRPAFPDPPGRGCSFRTGPGWCRSVLCDPGQSLRIHGGGQYTTMLMVRMVTAQLRPAGAEKRHWGCRPKWARNCCSICVSMVFSFAFSFNGRADRRDPAPPVASPGRNWGHIGADAAPGQYPAGRDSGRDSGRRPGRRAGYDGHPGR